METNEVDIELELAQRALAAAQQRKADAENAARLAAQAALAKNLADEQERLARLKQEAQESDKRHREKRVKEEEARRISEAAKAAETRRLEAELEKRNEALRKEAERQAQIRKVQEAAHQAELDAAALEASLRQANTPRVEPKPVTLNSPSHPLSRLFGTSAEVAAEPQALSSAEDAQQLKEKEKAIVEPAFKTTHYVDNSASRALEALLRPVLGMVNTQRCDELSSKYSQSYLLNNAKQIIEMAKLRPMGHDALFSFLESTLESVGRG